MTTSLEKRVEGQMSKWALVVSEIRDSIIFRQNKIKLNSLCFYYFCKRIKLQEAAKDRIL